MRIRVFDPADEAAVVALWRASGLTRPWNDPHRDIARKMTEQPELFLVGTVDGSVMASIMAGYDGHRGWVYYLAVDAAHRGAGHGRTLMREVERLLEARGCPKINLLVRTTNTQVLDFYRSIGYVPDNAVPLGRRLIPDV